MVSDSSQGQATEHTQTQQAADRGAIDPSQGQEAEHTQITPRRFHGLVGDKLRQQETCVPNDNTVPFVPHADRAKERDVRDG